MFRLLVGAGAMVCLSVMAGAPASAFTKQVSGREFAAMMQDALKGTRVYLHNLERRNGKPVHKANASFIRWGKGVGRGRKPLRFTLPELGRKIFDQKFLYYLNDIKSRRLSVKAQAQSFRLSLPFETGNLEFIGRCLKKSKGHKKTGCDGKGPGQVPALHWASPRVEIDFVPFRMGDNLSMHVNSVSVSGGLEVAELCRFKLITPRLCGRLNRFTKELRGQVSRYLMQLLNSRKMKLQIARKMRQVMNEKHGAGMFRVRRVAMNRGTVWLDMGF